MPAGENVVFLAFSNPKAVVEDSLDLLSCANCQNKTFTLVYSRTIGFPMLTCAACGNRAGRMGWAEIDEDEKP